MQRIDNEVMALVQHFAKYDPLIEMYDLAIDDLPEFELYNLCVTIMEAEPELAMEATSYNNANWPKMQTALNDYMRDITNKDNEIEYLCLLRESILSYFRNTIEDLIVEALEVYNAERAA